MNIVWRETGRVNSVSREHVVFRDDTYGVQKEVIIPRRMGKLGRPKVRYYIDSDPREFRREADLVLEYDKHVLKSIAKGQTVCGTDLKKATD